MQVLLYLAQPILACGIVFMVLTAVAFGARIWTKRASNTNSRWDDCFLALAIIFFYTETIIQLYCLSLAKEAMSMEDPLFVQYMKLVWISSTFAVPILSLLKLSILCFYRHIFLRAKRVRQCTNVLMGAVVVYCICGTAGEICESYDPAIVMGGRGEKTGKCMSMETYGNWLIAHIIVDTILDISVLILPIVATSQLRLARWKKFCLPIIYALGSATIATNIIRLAIILQNRGTDRIGPINEFWIIIHVGCGIICACLPTYTSLVKRAIPLFRQLKTTATATGPSIGVPSTPARRIMATNSTPGTDRRINRMMSKEEIELCELEHGVHVANKPSVDPFVDKAAEKTFDIV